jgi:hypothetical protein
LLHELADFRIALPTMERNFVSSNVKVVVGEQLSNFLEQLVHEFIGKVGDGIHGISLAIGLSSQDIVAGSQNLRISNSPRFSVGRAVKLSHNSNTSILGKLNDLLNLFLGINVVHWLISALQQK